VIRVYDGAGNVIETHGHAGDFRAVSIRPGEALAVISKQIQVFLTSPVVIFAGIAFGHKKGH
jgi:hypothetical protein